MRLGNIIYDSDLHDHQKVDYINYFKADFDYLEMNVDIPTLYVGWSHVKKCNKDSELLPHINILSKEVIHNKFYWEFSFKENSEQHIIGVESFVQNTPEMYFTSRYTYINLDPVWFCIEDVDDLSSIIPKEIDVAYNYKDEMLYLLKDNKITGIDLKYYSYFEFKIKKIKDNVYKRTTNVVEDLKGETYQGHYNKFRSFDHLKRYMPVIVSK